MECAGNGKCETDTFTGAARCRCKEGFMGAKCEAARTCPKNRATDAECSDHGVCNKSGGYFCRCNPGFSGVSCENAPPACPKNGDGDTCSGNGTCKSGRCACKPGFLGAKCDRLESANCKTDAAGLTCGGPANGKCFFGKCVCARGWQLGGQTEVCDEQELSKCPRTAFGECSGASQGTCIGRSYCACKPGFGDGLLRACEVNLSCPKDSNGAECSGRGRCERNADGKPGMCRCAGAGRFFGAACEMEVPSCGKNAAGEECNGVGTCLQAPSIATGMFAIGVGTALPKPRCVCPPTHKGLTCDDVVTCPKSEASGVECNAASNNNNKCDETFAVCVCDDKHTGEACDAQRRCPKNKRTGKECSENGQCDLTGGTKRSGNAFAAIGGGALSLLAAYSRPTCKCNAGYVGAACDVEVKTCPANAAGQVCSGDAAGKCDTLFGTCSCAFGRTGLICEKKPAIVGCGGAGPDACGGNGTCRVVGTRRTAYNASTGVFSYESVGVCSCELGYWGRLCEQSYLSCPSTEQGQCNGADSGRCNKWTGKCSCIDGKKTGDACTEPVATLPCPRTTTSVECNGASAGACDGITGTCRCVAPYFGAACEEKLFQCPTAQRSDDSRALPCSGNGYCDVIAQKCVCRPGYEDGPLKACDKKKECASTCKPNGTCNPFTGKCMCRYGYSGDRCESSCPADKASGIVCSGRGICDDTGSCRCAHGFTGADCSVAPCPANRETGEKCSGEGGCDSTSTPLRLLRPACKCTPGRFGYACQFNATALVSATAALREEVSAVFNEAGDAAAEKAACADPETPVLCPNVTSVSEAMRGTCQKSRRKCGSASAQSTCKANPDKRWCGVSCIDKKLRCPRARACKVGKVRCADGSCASRTDRCADASSLCVAGTVPCGDGVTCAADAAACRKAVPLDGCPVGQLACPSNPKECRANKKDCRCAGVDGERFCGWKRAESGRLVRGADGAKIAVCKVQCVNDGVNPLVATLKPAPITTDPVATSTLELTSDTTDDNGADVAANGGEAPTSSLGTVSIEPGAVKDANAASSATAVTFAAASVALTDLTEGSLKNLQLMSTALSLTPDRVVEIDPDIGIDIELCVDIGSATCDAVLKRLRPFSTQDLTADDASEVPGGCQKGVTSKCPCACRFTTPHLTTFAVADPEIAVVGEVTADQLDAGVASIALTLPTPAPAPTPEQSGDSSGGAGVPIGAIVGAIGAVAAIAAVVMLRQRAASASSRGVVSSGVQQGNPTSSIENVSPGDMSMSAVYGDNGGRAGSDDEAAVI
jgi:hypothetical protein